MANTSNNIEYFVRQKLAGSKNEINTCVAILNLALPGYGAVR